MKFCTAIAFIAVPFVIAKPMSLVFEVDVEIEKASDKDPKPVVCWKGFGDRSPVEECREGFQAFGPYCISTTKASDGKIETYERSTEKSSNVCPATSVLMTGFAEEKVCVQAECPSRFPSQCGLLCAMDQKSCLDTVYGYTFVIINIIKDINEKNLAGAIMKAQTLYNAIMKIPKCADEGAQQQGNVDAQMLQKVISLFNNFGVRV